jgi:hypothetical protein
MNKPPKPEKLACESCGNPFECGAKLENCWCFSLAIPEENLAQLNQQFQNCLCPECLSKVKLNEKLKVKN